MIGTTWQANVNALDAEKVPVEAILPEEGSTGWSDTWMVAARLTELQLRLRVAEPHHQPGGQRRRSRSTSARRRPTPSRATSPPDKGHCDTYHAGDASYADKIWYWTTPIEECLDGRTDVKCTDYGRWTQAWTEVKG